MVPTQIFFFGGAGLAIIGLILTGQTKFTNLCYLFGFISIIAGTTMFILSIASLVINPKTELEYLRYFNIYAIEDTSRINGSRFYIEEQDRYYYLADHRDGRKQFWISTSNSYIKEDDTVSPRIEVYRFVAVSKFWKWMNGDFYDTFEYKIIVPSKTLTTEFNIDLKK